MKASRLYRGHPIVAHALCVILSVSASSQTPTDVTPSVEELSKLKQNPLSGLREVEIQAVVNSGKTERNFSIQPVWPFSLGEDWNLITYTILPVVQLPEADGEDSVVGLGDTLINLFVTPTKPGAVVWGAGPAILLPTRTDPALGSNRLGLGPAAVLYYAEGEWSAGVVLQNVWSLGAASGIDEVNEFGGQYFITYNLPKGWFLYSNATVSADWTASTRDRWTVPVGGGFGKVFRIGKQSMSVSVQALSNVVRPRDGPTWTGIGQVSLLFP